MFHVIMVSAVGGVLFGVGVCGGCMWLGIGCLCEDSRMGWVSLIVSLTRLLCMNGSSWVRVVRLMGYWLAVLWLIML